MTTAAPNAVIAWRGGLARAVFAPCVHAHVAAAQASVLHRFCAAAGGGFVRARVVCRSGVSWGVVSVVYTLSVGVLKGETVHGRGTGNACVLDRPLERTFRPPGLAGGSGRSAS